MTAPASAPGFRIPMRLDADTAVIADTMAYRGQHSALVLSGTPEVSAAPRPAESGGESWVILLLVALFAAVSLRVKSNMHYIHALLHDLTQVRLRENVFDDTVRETSLLVMLNALWSCSAGVLLYYALLHFAGSAPPEASFGLPALTLRAPLCMGMCMGVAAAYTAMMTLAYFVVGTVFSDTRMASLWVKGYAAMQGLVSVAFFVLALAALCYPGAEEEILWGAGIIYLLGKIIFIWKGFRIFFTQISSWVLFLYYLCSLEIVPLILAFALAMVLCSGF